MTVRVGLVLSRHLPNRATISAKKMSHVAKERAELLRLLASMGIELPHSLDLPVRTLRRRIIKALDYSQALTELFGTN